MKCEICDKLVRGNLGLSKHLSNQHKISSEEYVVKFKYAEIKPLCACGCKKETNFNSIKGFDFSQFIRGHKDNIIKEKIETKRRKTCLENFGTVCSLQNKEVKEKTIKTNLERYGVEHYSKTKEYNKKMTQTTFERYGVEYYTQSEGYKLLYREKLLLPWKEILKYCDRKRYTPLFSYKEYQGNRDILKFRCDIHLIDFEAKMVNIQREYNFQCPKCKTQGTSKMEQEVYDFVAEHIDNVKRNTKSIIPPYELDIYIPSKNLAIEFNGLYWHCEINKENDYHYKKYKLCKDKGIQLIQIYEDEWRDNKEIWKSIIRNNLGVTNNKLNARDLIVDDDPSIKEIKEFVDNNHLQGYCRSQKKFVLKDKLNNIVFCVTFRTPFTKNKSTSIEIGRVCSLKNVVVRGGFSKIMKYAIQWAKEKGYEKILTYSDCRYSYGKTYEKYGFGFIEHTGKGYGYTDFDVRYNRFKFRAQPGKTEKEVAIENNIYKIFNAGNLRWEYLLKE